MQKVAVIGSGLNGLALAFGLSKIGVEVTLFEEKTFGANYENDTRTSFISHKSLEFFHEIAEEIKAKSGVIEYIYSFKNDSKFVSELGGGEENMGFVVDNSLLKFNLISYILKTGVKILENTKVETLENSKVETLENSKDGVKINGIEFDLAICASGANSSVHKLLGLSQRQIEYSQTAFVFDVSHEFPHKNIAIEAFDEACVIAILPKFEGKKSSVILSVRNEIAQKITEENLLEFLQEKAKRARHTGQIHEITTKICCYPLAMKFMKNQAINSTFFIGDSFHAIHPVLGQGFNMSLKDIAKLCLHIEKMQKLGVKINQNLGKIAIENAVNHIKIGLASHIFGSKFVSKNKIVSTLTNGAIAISQAIPTALKTRFLQKML